MRKEVSELGDDVVLQAVRGRPVIHDEDKLRIPSHLLFLAVHERILTVLNLFFEAMVLTSDDTVSMPSNTLQSRGEGAPPSRLLPS